MKFIYVMICACIPSMYGALSFGYVGLKNCPDVTVKEDFELDDYMGTWYEVARYPNPFENIDSHCPVSVYSPPTKVPWSIDVLNEAILPDGTMDVTEGIARTVDDEEPAKLFVQSESGGSLYFPGGNYWILDTDYTGYSLVHSCQNYFGLFHIQFNWIISRERTLDNDTFDQLYDTLKEQGIKTWPFIYSNQTGCGNNY